MTKKVINMIVDDFSTPVSVSVSAETPVIEIHQMMKDNGFRHMPVVKENKPIGIISDRDIKLISSLKDEKHLKASDIMVSDPFCTRLGTPIEEVAFEMSNRKIGSALIVDENGSLDSIFTSVDGLNALIEVVRGEAGDE